MKQEHTYTRHVHMMGGGMTIKEISDGVTCEDNDPCAKCLAEDRQLEEAWHRRMEIAGKGPYYIRDENGD